MEYNMKNILAEKSYTKCAAETIPRPFKISKLQNIEKDLTVMGSYHWFTCLTLSKQLWPQIFMCVC